MEPETPPVDLKTLFEVKIKVPSTGRNSYSAPVRIKITPSSDVMWDKVKYRVGDEDWEELKDNVFLYDGFYYTDVDVYYNAKIVVRLFGADGEYFDTKADISIFDHYAPEVTAGFKDMVLHVEAVDDLSQVAGIQVNGLLFTTLTDGKLDVRTMWSPRRNPPTPPSLPRSRPRPRSPQIRKSRPVPTVLLPAAPAPSPPLLPWSRKPLLLPRLPRSRSST